MLPAFSPPSPPRPPGRSFCRGVFFSSPCTIPSLLILSLLLLFFVFHHHHLLHLRRRNGDRVAPPPAEGFRGSNGRERFQSLFLSSAADGRRRANDSVSAHLRALTLGPHLAGTTSSAAVASYVLGHLRQSGFRVLSRDYRVLLSYPLRTSLSLVSDRGEGGSPAVKLLDLSEGTAPNGGVVPPYHAYSPSGSVLAQPVYANYGRDEDYRRLASMGVDVRGCVVVLRRGAGYRGAVVQQAAERGAAAVLLFAEEGVAGASPKGGVERGTVLLGGPGDPLTPGWAADNGDGAERLAAEDEEVRRRFPVIPSMPVPTAAAEEILRAAGGPPLPPDWRGALRLGDGGGGGGGVLLNFTYEGDRKLATIRDVFGVILGREEPDRYVVLGNHRDAWTYGAVDPNSGTAALLEVARRLGVLLREGWQPRRSIVLCSWDAEEFGMIGSTEWVEEYLQVLRSKAVAYLNVDCAVQGSGFFASVTPQLDKLLIEVTKKVKDPDSDGMTVYHTWSAANGGAKIERLGRADSDFTSFLHHAGVPSLDMYFGPDYPVYHTIFDSYDWMKQYGDPFFHRHVAASEIWGLMALHLADEPILPFDYLSYASQLQEHAHAVTSMLNGVVSIESINTSINDLIASATEAQEEGQNLREQESRNGSSELKIRSFNDRLMLAERGFLEPEGLVGRRWFKHTIYAPPRDLGSKISFFPGIADAVSAARRGGKSRRAAVQHEVWRVARAITRAALALRAGLP